MLKKINIFMFFLCLVCFCSEDLLKQNIVQINAYLHPLISHGTHSIVICSVHIFSVFTH